MPSETAPRIDFDTDDGAGEFFICLELRSYSGQHYVAHLAEEQFISFSLDELKKYGKSLNFTWFNHAEDRTEWLEIHPADIEAIEGYFYTIEKDEGEEIENENKS